MPHPHEVLGVGKDASESEVCLLEGESKNVTGILIQMMLS